MKLERVRKYRRRLNRTTGIFKENPVLTLGMALPFAVVASTTLQRGVFMSVLMLLSVLSGLLASRITGRRVHPVLRVALCCLVTLTVLTLVLLVNGRYTLLRKELGVYVPLIATNSISVHLLDPGSEKRFRTAAWEAFCAWIGFSFVMCVLSAVREIMSLHTLWEIPLPISTVSISGAALPCFGFILLGFFAALGRTVNRLRTKMLLRADNRPLANRKGESA